MIKVSSDEDDDNTGDALPSDPSEDDEDVKPQNRGSGKLKPVAKDAKGKTAKGKATSSKSPSKSKQSPSKAKATKAKSNTAIKDSPKGNGKTIYSFFNAATQRQQAAQPSPSPEKNSTPQQEPEAIQDDSENDHGGSVHLAKGSSTALAMRKRKIGHGDSFESDFVLPQSGSQKFRKTSSGERLPSMAILNEDKRPWTEQFGPRDLSELVVHKKKVADVHDWLEQAYSHRRQRILVLKGAAGTGKTTTIRLLAQNMKIEVTEWRNSAGAEMAAEGSASAVAQFTEFVGRAGRSGGLRLTSNLEDAVSDYDAMKVDGVDSAAADRNLLLVEEFPNTYSRGSSTLRSFRSTLAQYLASPPLPDDQTPTPIVLVISETLLSTTTAMSDSFTAHRLLGPELVNHPYLDMIEFNAVAPTLLTKALEAIVLKEARKSGRRRTPGLQVLKHLAESGDIRSAVSSLEFLCLRGDDGDTWSSKVALGKQKKSKVDVPLTKAEIEALKLVSNRESTLGIFHAVGKVVYNKRIDSPNIVHPPPYLPEHRRNKVPENDVDEMINELGTDASTFVAALHENYVLSCGNGGNESELDSLLGCISSLSDADLLSVDRFSAGTRAYSGSATDSLRQDEMSLQIAIRGMVFSLPHPVHRTTTGETNRADAHKMFYPASLKLWKKREEIEGVLELLTRKFQSGVLDHSPQVTGDAATGVGSWKRNDSTTSGSASMDEDVSQSTIINSMKAEMLVERLPYMAQILSAKKGKQALAEQVSKVTRIRGAVLISTEEGDDQEESEEQVGEQWATDKPDAEGNLPSPVKKRKAKSDILESGKSTLPVPVESSIEKLVLADDDIEDDF